MNKTPYILLWLLLITSVLLGSVVAQDSIDSTNNADTTNQTRTDSTETKITETEQDLTTPEKQICKPNEKKSCVTDFNCPGTITCSIDGTEFGECEDIKHDDCRKPTFKITRIGTNDCPAPHNIAMNWEKDPRAVKFTILSCTKKDCVPTKNVGETSKTQFVHRNLSKNTLYRYAIIAENDQGQRDRSQVSEFRTVECPDEILENKNSTVSPEDLIRKHAVPEGEIKKSTKRKKPKPVATERQLQKENIVRLASRHFQENKQKMAQNKNETIHKEIRTLSKEKIAELKEKPKMQLAVPKTIENQEKFVSKMASTMVLNKVIEEKELSGEIKIEEEIGNMVTEITERMQAAKEVKIEKIANVIEEQNDQGNTEKITIVTLLVQTPEEMSDFSVYEEIPKEIVESASELIFYDDNVEIVEDDPLIVWHFTSTTEELEMSYGIRDEIEQTELEQTTTMPLLNPISANAVNVEQPTEAKKENKKSSLKIGFSIALLSFVIVTVLAFKVINGKSPRAENANQQNQRANQQQMILARKRQIYQQRLQQLQRQRQLARQQQVNQQQSPQRPVSQQYYQNQNRRNQQTQERR